MALILCLETSSKNCSVSICENGKLLFIKEYFNEHYSHGEQLHVLIESLLIESNISISDFDAFAFSAGPGSYTGLRIGAASIKGFAFALDKPAIAVSTLQSMTSGLLNNNAIDFKNNSLFFPLLDSRVGEVYTAIYNDHCKEYLAPFACDVNVFSFEKYFQKHTVYFFGPGQYKLADIEHQNAIFLNEDYPSAKHLGFLAQHKFNTKKFIDVAYFEPMYLKNFIPTKPKKPLISNL